jgi:hypothetical protein
MYQFEILLVNIAHKTRRPQFQVEVQICAVICQFVFNDVEMDKQSDFVKNILSSFLQNSGSMFQTLCDIPPFT